MNLVLLVFPRTRARTGIDIGDEGIDSDVTLFCNVTDLYQSVVIVEAVGTGEAFDDGALHVRLILGGLHRGLTCQHTCQHRTDSFACRHLLVTVCVLYVVQYDVIRTVSVRINILSRGGDDGAAKKRCHCQEILLHIYLFLRLCSRFRLQN